MIRETVVLAFLLAASCTQEPAGGGSASARVAADAADLVSGPMAQGLVGDFVLENDRVRFVVERPGRDFGLNPYGGNVLDADRSRATGETGGDRLGELGLLVNAKHAFVPETAVIEGPGGAEAVVTFEGRLALLDYLNIPFMAGSVIDLSPELASDEPPPVRVRRRFRLAHGSRALGIETTFSNDGAAEVPLLVADLIDPGAGLSLFVPGTAHAPVFVAAPSHLVLAGDSDVSYGIEPVGSDWNTLVAVVGIMVLVRDARPTDLFGFPYGVRLVVPPGGELSVTSRLVVGDGDAASVEAELAATNGSATGRVVGRVVDATTGEPAAQAEVAVLDAATGASITTGRADAGGEFALTLPPGNYQLLAHKEGHLWADLGPPLAPPRVAVAVAPGQSSQVELAVGAAARLKVRVTDEAGGPLPARITVLGFDPSPPLSIFRDNAADPLPYGVARVAFLPAGEAELLLEPGTWRVVATRGLEYDLMAADISLSAGKVETFEAVLHRVVDTAGYVAADFHVHAGASSDSAVLLDDRVRAFAAEGLEYFALTEHEVVVDPRDAIVAAGVEAWLGGMAGQEITTAGYGHWNGFPLVVDPGQHNGGAIAFSGGARALSPAELAAAVRADPGDDIVQVNHPRRAPVNLAWQEYFTTIDLTFDAEGPRTGPMAIDPGLVRLDEAWAAPAGFDAIEVYNWANVGAVVDWWNFLNFGFRVAGTGNTDTHSRVLDVGGFPRTFVRVGVDDPRLVSEEDVVFALRGQQLTVAGGAFVTLRARAGAPPSSGEAGEGENLGVGGGPVDLVVRVQSPEWVPWDAVEIYENGLLIASYTAAPARVDASGGTRLEETIVHQVLPAADAWYVAVVRADAGRSLFPWVPYNTSKTRSYAEILVGAVDGAPRPMSFTNPVYVDSDGDGEITPSRIVVAPDGFDRYDDETFDRRTNISPVP